MPRLRRQLEEILGERGVLAKVIDRYDWRPQQLEMGRATLEALRSEQILLAEAPTGIGKTLAYLVPAALYARAEQEPVVISSYTKALQDQILRQEAPRLRRLVHPDLLVFALKGRSNYLCRRRWELFITEEGSGPDGHGVVERLQEWVWSTEEGDFATAPDLGARAGWVRSRIGGDAHFCRSRLCRPETGCFHKKARRAAREAQIVVVNHSLLLADALGPGLLPDHRALIIDEAHLFPEAAVEPLSLEVSEAALLRRIRSMGGTGEPGATDRLRRLLQLLPGKVAARNLTRRLRALEAQARECLEEAKQFYSALQAGELFPPSGERRRCRSADIDRLLPEETDHFLASLVALPQNAAALSSDIIGEFPAGDLSEEMESARQTADGLIAELAEGSVALQTLLTPQPEGRVHILGASPERGAVLSSVPLDPGPEIREQILSRRAGIVLTSATLATDRDLDYFAHQVGLESGEAHTLRLPSPFPLDRQLRVLVPTYTPDPRDAGYEDALARAIGDLAGKLPRKLLALFTAHETLARVSARLEDRADLDRSQLITQSRGVAKEQLATRFREAARAVLLGTTSFWYGMDFPGDELELLVITRLPFPVPSDPRSEALAERLLEEGRSHFQEYALPEAVLRFRQGIGRLIRRVGDRGVCVVLDPRILRARYGRSFRAVLPVAPQVIESPAELVRVAADWFQEASPRDAAES